MLHEEVSLVVSERMWHASIRMSKDVYGHLIPRSRENAAVVEKQPVLRGLVRPSGCEPETCGLRVA
jgi:hypothetical protein